MVTVPSEPGTGIGYSPPARKLAVSPDSATRLGSASERATPFCSSALMMRSVSTPAAISLLTITPNGAVPDSTTGHGDRRDATPTCRCSAAGGDARLRKWPPAGW